MNTYFYYLLFNFQRKMNDPNIHVFFLDYWQNRIELC